ncbi:leucyl/phenylalanyl-tRNA--protein transferase [bacterium]|nr:leucyl/phenylalanyl-tRNA--protein transferase [bacterium]
MPLKARGRGKAPPPLPPAESAASDGLVAVGGKLTPELILEAYGKGIFPMAEHSGLLGWWSPNPRAIIELDPYHVARSLRRRSRQFEVRVDSDWSGVLKGCARPEGTWISDEIEREYRRLFERGACHTVEAWYRGQLAGGLYGVSLGAAFMAESKFHHVRDASKVALVALVELLRERGYELLDVQYVTPHLARMGASWISRSEYLARLARAVAKEHVSFR